MPFDNYGNLSNEDLLNLARSAGYLGQEQPQPAPQEDVHQDYRTWGPASPAVTDPGAYQGPEATGPVTSPWENSSPPLQPGQTRGGSRSDRSFDPGKFAQVEKTAKGLEGEYQRADQRAYSGAREMMAPEVKARNEAVEAERDKANAGVDIITHQGEQALVMQRLQDEFAAEETRYNAQAQAMSNQAKADYMTALADFRASRVDPAQLWGNMTGGERFGTLVTAFVHDFLGAKGINTSAMATFNKAIDRNIDAQVQAIRTKGEVAEGFKSLWYMQRNQSASDTEARARVRGFLLEGAKQAVIANMAPYEAALASAQGKSAIAKIDEELAKTYIDVYKHADQNAIALRNQALSKWQTQVQAAMHQASIASNEKIASMQGKNENGGIEPIFDPETGQPKWFFQPWIQKEERAKTRETMEAITQLNKDLSTLRELARNSDSIADPIARTRFADTNASNYDALATRLAHNFAKANGERATDQDVADFKKGMPMKTWLTQANVDQMLAFTQESLLGPAKSKIRNVAFDMPEEMQKMYGTSASGTPFAGAITDASNTVHPPAATPEEILRRGADQIVAGPQGHLVLDEPSSEVKSIHKMMLKKEPQKFQNSLGNQSIGLDPPPMQFEEAMARYRRLARQGDMGAMDKLTKLARPFIEDPSTADDISATAAYMIYTMKDDPTPVEQRAEPTGSPGVDMFEGYRNYGQ